MACVSLREQRSAQDPERPSHGFSLSSPHAFTYGSGLDSFSNAGLSFFMQRLGAYSVDRRTNDPLYRLVLKERVTALLEQGQHGMRFPRRRRTRAGAPEREHKQGLLGTAPVAFRRALAHAKQANTRG